MSNDGDELKFTDIDPLEAARQLTLIEHDLFCSVDVCFFQRFMN